MYICTYLFIWLIFPFIFSSIFSLDFNKKGINLNYCFLEIKNKTNNSRGKYIKIPYV